jgi:hypothetical protein
VPVFAPFDPFRAVGAARSAATVAPGLLDRFQRLARPLLGALGRQVDASAKYLAYLDLAHVLDRHDARLEQLPWGGPA